MNNLLRFIVLLVLTVISSCAILFAQQQYNLYTTNTSSGKQVNLKWYSKKTLFAQSFMLYRKKEGGAYEKIAAIAPSPLISSTELNSAKNQFKNDDAYTGLITFYDEYNRTPATQQPLKLAGLYLSTVNNFNLAKHLGIAYEDQTVENGVRYQYKLSTMLNGAEVVLAESEPILVAPYSNIPFPATVTTNALDTKAAFSWSATPGYFFFKIYRGTSEKTIAPFSGNAIMVSTSNANSNAVTVNFTDDSLLNGTTYYYQLEASDVFNQNTMRSTVLLVTPRDMTAPAALENVTANRVENTIEIKWEHSLAKDISNYLLQRSTNKKDSFIVIASIDSKTTTYSDKNLVSNQGYYYQVRCKDLSGNVSAVSNTAFAMMPDLEAPLAPKNVKAVSDTGIITISWDANTESDLKGYVVYRGLINAEQNYTRMMIEPIKTNHYSCALPKEARNKFNFRITAIDQNYNESPFAYIQAQMPDVTPPLPPYLTAVQPNASSIKLAWTASASSDVKTYTVLTAATNDSMKQWMSISTVPNTQTTLELAAPAASSNYAIIATDSAGLTSVYSNVVFIEKQATAEAMQLITNINGFYDSTMNSIQITYDASDFLLTTHYHLFQKIANSTWLPVPESAGENRIAVHAVETHQTYTFKVMWQDENGFYHDCSKALILTIP